THLEEKLHPKVKEHFDEALKIERTLDYPELLFATLYDLAEWHLGNDQMTEAEKYALECQSLISKLDIVPEIYKLYHLLTKINHNKEEYDRIVIAHDLYFEASEAFRKEREEILIEYKKFQAELIMAAFEAKEMAHQFKTQLLHLKWGVALIVTIIVLVLSWHFWFRKWRKNLFQKLLGDFLERG
ncbi:MAG: hypothetical protein AAF391_04375, partial [Bacteroidota bacterium]